jgi:hypothetical protein
MRQKVENVSGPFYLFCYIAFAYSNVVSSSRQPPDFTAASSAAVTPSSGIRDRARCNVLIRLDGTPKGLHYTMVAQLA